MSTRKSVVIVESPTKSRTISRFLGGDFQVLASLGHVRDLPESSLGVDVQNNFKPVYALTANGKRVLEPLRTAVGAADRIYLATDPDREGEAIAWHLEEILKGDTQAAFQRVAFHEITGSAVAASFEHPTQIDMNKVNAQQARRVLDRLVGYQVSPLLWKDIQKGTSAGRVQSVALRLVCERERVIQDFKPLEYWNLDALFQADGASTRFLARLALLDGEKPQIGNASAAAALAAELEQAGFRVADVARKPRKQAAPPPFITSTLQQAAGNALRLSTSQAMRIAQQLYEGIELGKGEACGLITYMRTDSVEVSKEAQAQARDFIRARFGGEFLPETPNVYRSRKSAQEAHEAIRPTDVSRTPEAVAPYLTPPQLRLYRLIWNRFVASQMAPAAFVEHVIEVEAKGEKLTHTYRFRAAAREMTFAGYLLVYNVKELDQGEEEPVPSQLPVVVAGTGCTLVELGRKQCFTEPPKRYTEAMLVRELEQNGVGRPSTYATIINTILERSYVTKEKGRLFPSPLGYQVNDYLVAQLPELFDVNFTARMEGQLDEVEEGKVDWTDMLRSFNETFQKWLAAGPSCVLAPAQDKIAAFMAVFPPDLAWHPPTQRGRRVYDDQRFFNSLREQLGSAKKALSDRQWLALLTLAARYADKIPGLLARAAEVGVLPKLQELIQVVASQQQAPSGPDPDATALVQALAAVQWAPPTKRGRRTFNDRRFYRSLCDQVEAGNRLTTPQLDSLKRLIAKYHKQVPDAATVSARFGIELPKESPESRQDGVDGLLALVDQIKDWAPPRKRGSRVYDDKQFAESIGRQYAQRGGLSPKQIAALRSMLIRYRAQIPEFEQRSQELGLEVAAKVEAKPLDVACPKCGAFLVARRGRAGEFFGCSAFPKCRFTSATLPGDSGEKEDSGAPEA